jgi:hypothetical protein
VSNGRAIVTGLPGGVTFIITVIANTVDGPLALAPVTLALQPRVPNTITDLSGIASNESVDLRWSAPADNGSAITRYDVSSSPAAVCIVTDLSARCVGLKDGTVYTFTVTARNSIGNSVASNIISLTPV